MCTYTSSSNNINSSNSNRLYSITTKCLVSITSRPIQHPCITIAPSCQWMREHYRIILGSKCEGFLVRLLCGILLIFFASFFSEYYFSDENLQKDFFLRRQVSLLCCGL